MTLFVTGGTGFVLSNLVRHWLETDVTASAVVLDAAPWDETIERFFAPVRERLTFIQADILAPAYWEPLLAGHSITHIIHGATITPLPERERTGPQQILEVNIMGTVKLLEWARALPSLHRFIYISSGAIYSQTLPGTPAIPTPEEGYIAPIELYAISKLTSEHITRRYSQLFGLDAVSVRFSGVYGPMDRATPARAIQSLPYRLTQLALAGAPIKVNALEAGGDWIHAGDVARALVALLRTPNSLQHRVYNIAYGQFTTVGQLLEIIHEVIPTLHYTVVPEAEANIIHDPRHRQGRWGAYDISRLRNELGWQPRPIRQALQSYLVWAREEADRT